MSTLILKGWEQFAHQGAAQLNRSNHIRIEQHVDRRHLLCCDRWPKVRVRSTYEMKCKNPCWMVVRRTGVLQNHKVRICYGPGDTFGGDGRDVVYNVKGAETTLCYFIHESQSMDKCLIQAQRYFSFKTSLLSYHRPFLALHLQHQTHSSSAVSLP